MQRKLIGFVLFSLAAVLAACGGPTVVDTSTPVSVSTMIPTKPIGTPFLFLESSPVALVPTATEAPKLIATVVVEPTLIPTPVCYAGDKCIHLEMDTPLFRDQYYALDQNDPNVCTPVMIADSKCEIVPAGTVVHVVEIYGTSPLGRSQVILAGDKVGYMVIP